MSPIARPLSFATLTLALCACFDPPPRSSSVSPAGSSASTGVDPTSEGASSTSATSTGEGEDTTEVGDESTSTSFVGGESSSTSGAAPACGDGTLDEGEGCDDGNDSDLDGCSVECESLYHSGNDDRCSVADTDFCGVFGAQCRVDASGMDGVCYWMDATVEDQCDGAPGIWTQPGSSYAMDNPEASFPEPGVCIAELPNLYCAPENAAACAGAGSELCFQSLDPSGTQVTGPDICWWDTDQGGCEATSGIWTLPRDGFAQDHPNALPEQEPGCIVQVTNL